MCLPQWKKTSLGIEENLEALLCYILGWVTGLIFYLLEKENKFIRFHAMQSILTFFPLSIIIWILFLIPFIGWVLGGLLSILSFVLWVVLMIKAYQGEKYKLPIVGRDMAQRYSQ